MRFVTRILANSLLWLIRFSVAVAFAATIAVGLYCVSLLPELPDITNVDEIELKVPLRVYTTDDQLIAEYGDERRQPVDIANVPDTLKRAILSTEDVRFYDHIGVDFLGVVRAALANFRSGGHGQGASTITMQVARNFFLTPEKTYERKLNEVLLSFRLERALTKDQILELYLNKIFLGHRAYGFAAAAKVYYDGELSDLSTAQLAMLAGLPKAPSTTNPLTNPTRAKNRRNFVLSRMRENNWLSDADFEAARDEPISADLHTTKVDVQSPYVAEEIRRCVVDHFSDSAYGSGLKVYTTINPRLQAAAVSSVRNGVLDYEIRHGWRGPVDEININDFDNRELLNDKLNEYVSSDSLRPAVVFDVAAQSATLLMAGDRNHPEGVVVDVSWEGIKWARRFETVERIGPELTAATEILAEGQIVYVKESEDGQYQLSQLPDVSAALIAMQPDTGAIRAMAGGFDYYISKFNRVTQAERQPGSNIKPFIYSAAIDTNDVTPATRISGAPITVANSDIELPWRPENYSGKFVGPTRLREALAMSLNLVSVRLLKHVGTSYTRNYLTKFGFDQEKLPDGLPLALGATSITPVELASAYAVFANGGYRIQPYLIERVEDSKGNIIDWNTLITTPRTDTNAADASATASNDTIADAKSEYEDGEISFADPNASGRAEQKDPSTLNPLCLAGQTRVCRNCESKGDPQSLDDLKEPTFFVEQSSGVQYQAAERVITPETAFIMRSLMGQVIQSGTARKAKEQLGRNDLAGKTGTTNDFRDAWFSGFNDSLTATVWFGYDQPASLGRGESGARAALPIWIDFMRTALDGVEEKIPAPPPGIVQRHVDQETGAVVAADAPGSVREFFKINNAPTPIDDNDNQVAAGVRVINQPEVPVDSVGTSDRPAAGVNVDGPNADLIITEPPAVAPPSAADSDESLF